MKLNSISTFLLLPSFLFFLSCNDTGNKNITSPREDRDQTFDSAGIENSKLEKIYTNIPASESYYTSAIGLKLKDTLESRFAADFNEFANAIKNAHAKLIVCYTTSETGRSSTVCEEKERPFFNKLCNDHNVQFIDFTEIFKGYKPKEISFMPLDGHFNKKGAALIADKLSSLIDENKNVKSDVTYPANSRPAWLADNEPGVDKIVEEKKGLPYRLITNSQGLRMTGNVEFPKTKQHILFMGDSEMFFAGLDNPETATGLLEKKYPDKTIMNAAKWAYTIDDEYYEWQERSKYTEADIVFLQITGEGVPNLFFSNKLKFHRPGNKKIYSPTPLEQQFYDASK